MRILEEKCNYALCIICQQSGNLISNARGCANIRDAASVRNDHVGVRLNKLPENQKILNPMTDQCYSRYVDKHELEQIVKRQSGNLGGTVDSIIRSKPEQEIINYAQNINVVAPDDEVALNNLNNNPDAAKTRKTRPQSEPTQLNDLLRNINDSPCVICNNSSHNKSRLRNTLVDVTRAIILINAANKFRDEVYGRIEHCESVDDLIKQKFCVHQSSQRKYEQLYNREFTKSAGISKQHQLVDDSRASKNSIKITRHKKVPGRTK